MLSLFKQRKLRVDIAMIFISVLLMTTLSIIAFTYQRNSRVILNMAHQLTSQMDQTIVTSLDNYLRPPFFIYLSNPILKDKKLSLNEVPHLNRYFTEAQDIYPQINSIYLTDLYGNFYLMHRVTQPITEPYPVPVIGNQNIPANTKYILLTLRRSQQKSLITINYTDNQYHVLKTEHLNKINYDPVQRPWFQGAQHSNHSYWFGVYQFFITHQLGLTVASPVVSQHQAFSGVIAADFSMDGFVEKFKKIVMESKSGAIIFNQKGDVIAYQGFNNNQSLPANIVNIQDLHDSVIQKAYSIYEKKQQQQFIFSVHDTQYIAYISPYASNFNENWKIATVVPLNVFIGAMKSTNYYTILFSLLMVLIGLLLVTFAADRISKPIMRIASDMKKMQQLLFSKTINKNSSIFEIQIISDALGSTQSALSSFAKYVPKMLVRQLLKNKSTAQLGGVEKQITILFTDIDNYTATSESMDPDALIAHISEYLNEMTAMIHQYAGNIDKYIGDAVMAFWNDPEEDPDHILHACQAVLACQMKMKAMNAIWQKAGKPILTTRFGLNAGSAIVGNMGSNDRLNYTVIGNNVNLAARLETINKVYGTEIIVSDPIYQHCQAQMLFRPLDIVIVRGKNQPTKIYELIAAKSSEFSLRVATEQEILLCELSTQGYEAFHRDDLATAHEIFTHIQTKFPNDTMAQFYLKRLSVTHIAAVTNEF